MKRIYDITKELFSSEVYPGDTAPTFERAMRISAGDVCNLTDISMCAHNGTHIDAPCHFVDGGKSIEMLDLDKCIGEAFVITFGGVIGKEEIDLFCPGDCTRLLIKGNAELNSDGCTELIKRGIKLVGVEAQSVGYAPIHTALLSNEIVILEGIDLSGVEDGEYCLFAAPIKLGGSDGAPCRAILTEIEK